MGIHRNAKIGVVVLLIAAAIGTSYVAGSKVEPTLPKQLSAPSSALTAAQKSDAAAGAAVSANRKNLAPGSEQVTASSAPVQTIVEMHFVHGKLQTATTITAHIGENLKLVITCDDMDDEYDIIITAFVQRATCSQNSGNALEFTPGVTGTFPIEFQPEDSDRTKVGELVVQ